MNQKTLNQLVGLCCFLLAANTGFSQPVTKHAFSLKDCVEFSHKNNVQVKNALLNVQIQKQINKDITAAAMPTINANIGGNDYLKIPTSLLPGEIFGQPAGSYIPVQFGTKFNANAGISLQQLLFDGQVFVGLRTRNTTIEFQNKNVDQWLYRVGSIEIPNITHKESLGVMINEFIKFTKTKNKNFEIFKHAERVMKVLRLIKSS
jgi:hypothetical protein